MIITLLHILFSANTIDMSSHGIPTCYNFFLKTILLKHRKLIITDETERFFIINTKFDVSKHIFKKHLEHFQKSVLVYTLKH